MRMVRKQIYLTAEQDAKLKRLAARHGCTEAEIVRELVEERPEDELEAALRQAGLRLAPRRRVAPGERERAEREWREWADQNPGPLGLVEALLKEREESW